jgi:hypothetical protein
VQLMLVSEVYNTAEQLEIPKETARREVGNAKFFPNKVRTIWPEVGTNIGETLDTEATAKVVKIVDITMPYTDFYVPSYEKTLDIDPV